MQRYCGILLVCLFTAGLAPVHAQVAAEEKAVEVARGWLKLVDDKKYIRSWESAATYFRNAVTKKQWKQALTAVRSPLGAVISRSLKSAQYTTALPGAPDGKYVVIQFETAFENKQNSVETVTPMLEKNGDWRVSGYYIK